MDPFGVQKVVHTGAKTENIKSHPQRNPQKQRTANNNPATKHSENMV